jgi:hypothetical protein
MFNVVPVYVFMRNTLLGHGLLSHMILVERSAPATLIPVPDGRLTIALNGIQLTFNVDGVYKMLYNG